MTSLPPDVDAAVRHRWPQQGAAWSDTLTTELADLCTALQVTPRRTYAARFAFVVQATTVTGATLVLRSTPDPDARHQAAVLQRLSDIGLAPRLHGVHSTPTGLWTVSDAVYPGTHLRDDTREPHRRADVLALLRTLAAGHAGPTEAPAVTPWIRDRLTTPPLDDMPPGGHAAPEEQRSEAIDLLDTMEPVPADQLCHGDASLGNALVGRDRLWLIDPRGFNGEPAYDIAVIALKACNDDAVRARPIASELAANATADADRAVRWVTIAAAARV